MRNLHLVSHTHWDREWYRPFQDFRLRLVHLIDGLLELLDSDPKFKCFTLDGQTIILDDYLVMRPENFSKIQKYVKNGRLVIGPWHILPDEYLVSPEATIRNLLEGSRTCSKFGSRMNIGYIPDPFGHISQMPQILKGFNINSTCVQRGLSDEACEFWWESPDGSRVFMAYLRDGYGNAAGLPVSEQSHFTSEIRRLRDSLIPYTLSQHHILLMHGTDHMEPHPGTSSAIAGTRGKLDGDNLIHSTLDEYVHSVQQELKNNQIPIVSGELRDCKRSHLLPGVLSTRMWIKQRNRQCENLLEKWVEPFSTFASLLHEPTSPSSVLKDPSPIISHAWRLLMECHPHDSICGCSIDQVHEEMDVRFDQVEQIGGEILYQSLKTIAASINTSRPRWDQNHSQHESSCSSALIVFNPHSYIWTQVVETDVESNSPFDLLDQDGKPIVFHCENQGPKELIAINLTPDELQKLYTAVHDGRVMGFSILEMEITRKGDVVHLMARVSEQAQPNLKAWQDKVKEIESLMRDSAVSSFQIKVFSMDTARINFIAEQVPGLGWKTFFVRPCSNHPDVAVQLPAFVRPFLPLIKIPFLRRLVSQKRKSHPPYRIESDLFIVEVQSNGLLKVTDKKTGKCHSDMHRFIDGGDCGDEYNYCPPEKDEMYSPRLESVFVSDDPIIKTLDLSYELITPTALTQDRKQRSKQKSKSTISTSISIADGIPSINILTTIDNKVKDHRLRVHFPASLKTEKAEVDGHFEVLERKLGIPTYDDTWVEQPRPEMPQRSFTSISDGIQRMTISNRGLPEVEVFHNSQGGTEIALTLLRCVGWLSRDDFPNRKGHAGPFMETPGAQMQGQWNFEYSLSFDLQAITSRQAAYSFETPLQVVSTGVQDHGLYHQGTFIQTSPQEFLVSAIKQSRDEEGWLLRGYNQSSNDIRVSLQTILPFNKVYWGNLAEEKIKKLYPEKDGTMAFKVKGHEIVTILFHQ